MLVTVTIDKKDNEKYWAETSCYLLRCIFQKMIDDLVGFEDSWLKIGG